MPFLTWLVGRLRNFDSIGMLRPRDTKKCEKIIKKIIASISETPVDAVTVDFVATDHCSRVSQGFARELKVMDLVFEIATIPATFNLDTHYDQKAASFTDKEYSRVANLVSLSWTCLETMFLNNRLSEDYFARRKGWISKTISLISDPIGAAVAFGKLISNNAYLVERYVNHDIISNFKSLIMSKGFQSRLLMFFVSICTCQGKAIVSNQEAVLSQVWLQVSDREQMLFALKEDENMAAATKWETKTTTAFPDVFLGKECVQSAFKRVLVSWSKTAQLKDFFVNGKQECSVEELCWVLDPTTLCKAVTGKDWNVYQARFEDDKSGFNNSVAFNRQWDLAMYFKSQLELYAGLCRGRSYASIFELTKHLSYTMLVSLMNSRKLPYTIRSSIVRVLHTVYIDRYPHSHNCGRPSLPDLVWDSSSLRDIKLSGEYAGVEGALPCFRLHPEHSLKDNPDEFYSIDSHSKFFLVRDFISNFMHEGGGVVEYSNTGRDKNAMVGAVLDVLADLMSFGFYSTREKIDDVCLPMNRLLDGRTDEVSVGGTTHSNTKVSGLKKAKMGRASRVVPMAGGDGANADSEVEDIMRQLAKRKNIGSLRFSCNSRSAEAHKAKVYILRTLLKIADMRAHYRCSQVLQMLKERAAENHSVLTVDGNVSSEFFAEVEHRLFHSEDGTGENT